MTEKRRPAHSLQAFKRSMADGRCRVTSAALRDAASLGFGRREIAQIVHFIEPRHFSKSMTAYADHRSWQDVYYVPSEAGTLYVKFAADRIDAFLLLSFKEKTDG